MESQKRVLLLIIDGWGVAPANDFNIFSQAETPFIDELISEYPATSLINPQAELVDKSYQSLGAKGELKQLLAAKGKAQTYLADSEAFVPLYYYFSDFKDGSYPRENKLKPISRPQDNNWQEYNDDIQRELIQQLKAGEADFLALAMSILEEAAHLRDLEQARLAIEALDIDLRKIIPLALDSGYRVVITSTHGQLEALFDPVTEEYNERTSNPVPLLIIDREFEGKNFDWPDVIGSDLSTVEPAGDITDITPTILQLLGLADASVKGLLF